MKQPYSTCLLFIDPALPAMLGRWEVKKLRIEEFNRVFS